MRVTEEVVQGWRTCARPQDELERDCEGYQSEPTEVVRRTEIRTFGDRDTRAASQSPDISAMLSDSSETILPVDHEDPAAWRCPHCDGAASFSLVPRAEYPRRSTTRPDELVRRARGDTQRADEAVALQLRQVVALERANELRERELAAAEGRNGSVSASAGEDDPTPAPTRRTRTRAAS